MKKKIFAGITQDDELYYMEINTKSGTCPNFHLSMTGTTLRIVEEGEGKEEARERLEDDNYFWKQAVEADSTTLGFNDWVDMVLDIDGWDSIFDFDYELTTEYESKTYYFDYSAYGQHQEKTLKHYFIDKKLYNLLNKIWDKHHLKNTLVDSGSDKAIIDEVFAIKQDIPKLLQNTISNIIE